MAIYDTSGLSRRINIETPRPTTSQKNMLEIGFKALEEYINYLDVFKLEEVHYQTLQQNMSSTLTIDNLFDVRVRCSSLKENFKYFDNDQIKAIIVDEMTYPKLNEDVLCLATTDLSLDDFSIYEFETVVNFEFRFIIREHKDFDSLIFILKQATEPLLFRKFSESVDEEIVQELGEDE